MTTQTYPIIDCSLNLGPVPRRFSALQKLNYLKFAKPIWLRRNPSDLLNTLFDHRESLWEHGQVVWGHVLQTHNKMYKSGSRDRPGQILFSLCEQCQEHPSELYGIAKRLSELRSEAGNNQGSEIVESIDSESTRVYGLKVPDEFSPNLTSMISSTLFVRRYLPERRICRPLMPIIVNPQPPHVAMVLPEKYWPKELLLWWRD
ncbi:MAG: hypothetical protein AAF483_13805 [Planctomycetota bacterium]